MGQDGQGFSFAVFIGESVQISFSRLVTLEKEGSGLTEGPLEMGVADFFTARAHFSTTGLFGAFYQSAVRGKVLDGWKAVDVFDFVEDNQPQDFSDAGDGLEQSIGQRVVVFGGLDDIAFKLCDYGVVCRNHGNGNGVTS